ncbi:MAG: type IV secretory system conjugative DNA transfer family protein [Actinomycetota bacterium]|nr:type IV secretory system conjugative DNA transfer family protein [Actinomycetota bacterium]
MSASPGPGGPAPGLDALWSHQRQSGSRLYIGTGPDGLVFAGPQQGVLVLGPPRSGKTTTLVVPNVLAAAGPVIATSTKPEVMAATAAARSLNGGRCWLFDPAGTTPAPPGVTPIRWSPITSCELWDEALLTARAMVGAARPGPRPGDAGHWLERAEAVLSPLLHAAALGRRPMADVSAWVLRHDLDTAAHLLAGRGATMAADVLAGLSATHGRELSAIFSTTAGVLAAYRSASALAVADEVNFDPRHLARSQDTVYLCASAREQDLLAPITVAFIEAARDGAYQAARDRPPSAPLTLVLDEATNIAPLPALPSLVSEGGGQGVLTVVCLQDLSQARERWGPAADGFGSLFGTKVVLPGIGELATLELVSRLGGEIDVPSRSVSRTPWWALRSPPTETWSTQRQRRLPIDAVHHQPPQSALVLRGASPPARVGLRPWWDIEPFRRAPPAPVPTMAPGDPVPNPQRRHRAPGPACQEPEPGSGTPEVGFTLLGTDDGGRCGARDYRAAPW